MVNLSGWDVAKADRSKTVATVQCPWCEHVTEIPYGPQHRYGASMDVHCASCARFFSHRVADAWFDQHDKKLQDEREVWKRIPEDAYLTARASSRGANYVYTLYLGKGDPTEYFARDSVEHKLINEFGMSWAQANAILSSAILDGGRKIYFQRLTKISSALENRLPKTSVVSGGPQWPFPKSLIPAGTSIRVNGHDGLYLRPSHHDGFAIVALNGFGDTEVPMVELEVIDVADEFELEEQAEAADLDAAAEQAAQALDTVENVLQHEEVEGDEGEKGEIADLEKAQEHLEDAIEMIGDVSDEEVEEAEEHGETEHEHSEDDKNKVVSFDDEKKSVLSARDLQKRAQGSSPEERRMTLQNIINDPMSDPEVVSAAQRALVKLQQQPTSQPNAPSGSSGGASIALGAEEDDDDKPDVGECQGCGSPYATELGYLGKRYHVRCRNCGLDRSVDTASYTANQKKGWWYKAPKEIQTQFPKDVSSVGPEDNKATEDSELYPKKDKNLYPKTVTKSGKVISEENECLNCGKSGAKLNDSGLCAKCNRGRKVSTRTALNRDAQRKVHAHYSHSHDLRRAISVNRNELGIEDIRAILAHYVNTGHLAKGDADELSDWFIGSKPRLLSARDVHKNFLGASDFQKAALLEKGIGIFTPALYKGKEVLVIAIDNTGTKATVQDGEKKQIEVLVRDLTPATTGPYSGEPGNSYSRTFVHRKTD